MTMIVRWIAKTLSLVNPWRKKMKKVNKMIGMKKRKMKNHVAKNKSQITMIQTTKMM